MISLSPEQVRAATVTMTEAAMKCLFPSAPASPQEAEARMLARQYLYDESRHALENLRIEEGGDGGD